MQNIKLTASGRGATPVPDFFIDKFMIQADGEYVKIYLFLLKSFYAGDTDITISGIADRLEETERDIIRALKYWEKNNVIKTEIDESGAIVSIDFSDGTGDASESTDALKCAPKATEASLKNTKSSADSDEFRELILSAEKYFGRTLRATDVDILLNMIDNIGISYELADYLLCYAVERDKKSMRYVEATGIAWKDEGITTVAQAKEHLQCNNDIISCVMKAFGLQKRNPGTSELDYIAKWRDNYSFDVDIILEACNRTMSAINQPSFHYADKILSNWHEKGIKSFSDIKKLDDEYNESLKKSTHSATKKSTAKHTTRFHNFDQRDIDYDDLERRIAENNTKKYGDT